MGRFDKFKDKLSRDSLAKTGFWEDTMPLINQGSVVPVIGNSFLYLFTVVKGAFVKGRKSRKERHKNPCQR